MKRRLFIMSIITALGIGGVNWPAAYASTGTTFVQQVGQGVMSVNILDANQYKVTNPTVKFPIKEVAGVCQTDFNDPAKAAILGTADQSIYATIQEGSAPNGWTLALAPTAGPTAQWRGMNGSTMDIDEANNPCSDNIDGDPSAGVMGVKPGGSMGTIANACSDVCDSAGVSFGQYGTYSSAVNSILIAKSNAVNKMWRGTLNGTEIYQTIPANQAADVYTLPMTLTLTAL